MNRWIWMNSIMDRIWFIMMIICSSSSSEGNNPQILVYPQISDCFNYELPESLLPRGGGFCLRHPPPPLPLYSDKWGLYQVIKSPIVLIWCSVPSNWVVITLFFTLYFPWSFGFSLCCLFLPFRDGSNTMANNGMKSYPGMTESWLWFKDELSGSSVWRVSQNIALESIVWFVVKHIRNKANVPLNYSAAIDILAVNYRVQ